MTTKVEGCTRDFHRNKTKESKTILNFSVKGFKPYPIEGYNKNQQETVYTIYKHRNILRVNPQLKTSLNRKYLINENYDGSVSLNQRGIRLLKRVLELKGEVYSP